MLNHKLNPHIPNEAAKIKNFYLITVFQNFEEFDIQRACLALLVVFKCVNNIEINPIKSGI